MRRAGCLHTAGEVKEVLWPTTGMPVMNACGAISEDLDELEVKPSWILKRR